MIVYDVLFIINWLTMIIIFLRWFVMKIYDFFCDDNIFYDDYFIF